MTPPLPRYPDNVGPFSLFLGRRPGVQYIAARQLPARGQRSSLQVTFCHVLRDNIFSERLRMRAATRWTFLPPSRQMTTLCKRCSRDGSFPQIVGFIEVSRMIRRIESEILRQSAQNWGIFHRSEIGPRGRSVLPCVPVSSYLSEDCQIGTGVRNRRQVLARPLRIVCVASTPRVDDVM